jgi:1-phosphofructokinase family hexose kinase
MILCVGLTPAVQRVMIFSQVSTNAVNRATAILTGAAGKSVNACKALKLLGEKPVAMGFVGGARGAFLAAALRSLGIATAFVEVVPETRLCITVIDQAAATQTELVEEGEPVSESDYARLHAAVSQRLPGCAALVLSGSLTPGGPEDTYQRCAEAASQAGVLCAIDARGPALARALSARPALVKPNRTELAATVGRSLEDERSVLSAAREVCDRGAQRVAVTAGQGPVLAFDGHRAFRITPPRIAPVNPIGSGDVFTAAAVARLVKGDDLAEACRWGVAAGSANALTWMPGEFRLEDLEGLRYETRVESIAL